jgi:uncharacterized cupredoxin-like copper-binding protein
MKLRISLFVLLALSAVLLLSACGPKKTELNVDMTDFKFTPDTYEVPAGGEVTLNLNNKGTLEHEYVIMALGKQATIPFDADDEPNVFWEAELEAGKSESVTFTAPTEPGEYEVVCGTPGHLEQKMQGKLTVTK